MTGPPPGSVTPEEFFAGLDVAAAPRELVALGGRLDVPTMIAAYRAGCFPWPATGPHKESLEESARQLASSGEVPVLPSTDPGAGLIPWLSPEPRPVLMADSVHIPRSLRRQLRSCGWETTAGAAFEAVLGDAHNAIQLDHRRSAGLLHGPVPSRCCAQRRGVGRR